MNKTILLTSLSALLLVAAACASDGASASGKADSVGTPASAPQDGDKPAPKPREKPTDKPTEKPTDKPAETAKAELGKAAPAFALKDLDGKEHTLAQYKGKVVVLEWFSPGCPMCKWAYGTGGPLAELPARLKKDGVVWLAVNSEAPDRAPASAEANKTFAEKYGMKSPILFDPTGAVGKSYGAKSTPHIFIIDEKGNLVYRGALDNAPNGKVSGEGARVDYVSDAIADLKAGRAVKQADTKAYG